MRGDALLRPVVIALLFFSELLGGVAICLNQAMYRWSHRHSLRRLAGAAPMWESFPYKFYKLKSVPPPRGRL